jgi:hypothetical protein
LALLPHVERLIADLDSETLAVRAAAVAGRRSQARLHLEYRLGGD